MLPKRVLFVFLALGACSGAQLAPPDNLQVRYDDCVQKARNVCGDGNVASVDYKDHADTDINTGDCKFTCK